MWYLFKETKKINYRSSHKCEDDLLESGDTNEKKK